MFTIGIENVSHIIAILLPFSGLLLSLYVWYASHHKLTGTCFAEDGHCGVVTSSAYGKLFGFSVASYGAWYYVAITVASILFFFRPDLLTPTVILAKASITFGAVVFSGYLTLVQFLVLKKLCQWCLSSTFITALVFLEIVVSVGMQTILSILLSYQEIVLLLRLFAIIAGTATSVVFAHYFLKFVEDFTITAQEAKSLHKFSQTILMTTLSALVVYTGYFVLSLVGGEIIAGIEIAVVVSIMVATFILLFSVIPELTEKCFQIDNKYKHARTCFVRTSAFALSLWIIVSWIFLYLLAMQASYAQDILFFATLYILLTGIAMIGGQTLAQIKQ